MKHQLKLYGSDWLVAFGDHIIFRESAPKRAVEAASKIVGYERNVRVIAPNGMRLSVQAASFLA